MKFFSEEKEKQKNITYEDHNNELHSFIYLLSHSMNIIQAPVILVEICQDWIYRPGVSLAAR